MIDDYITKLKEKISLTVKEAESCLRQMLEEDVADKDKADLLIALAEKGEAVDEIVGFSKVLIENAAKINLPKDSIELVGTGGSSLSRFNISTTASFVLAAGGVPVVKHGNKGSKKPNGSFDLLEKLECFIPGPPEILEEIFNQTNISFLFARSFHPAMKAVVKARQMAGRRTIFNLIGPLCNPVQPDYQVLGTISRDTGNKLAETLRILNRKQALIVIGTPGIDEVSISGTTEVFELDRDEVRPWLINPEEMGVQIRPYDEIPGGDCDENAELFVTLLKNKSPQSLLDMLCLNVGAAFYCFGKAANIKEGFNLAKEIVTSGQAYEKYLNFKEVVKKIG